MNCIQIQCRVVEGQWCEKENHGMCLKKSMHRSCQRKWPHAVGSENMQQVWGKIVIMYNYSLKRMTSFDREKNTKIKN